MKKLFSLLSLVLLLALTLSGLTYAGIVNSLHDFRGASSGGFPILGLTQVCKPCHVPHAAGKQRLLWAQSLEGTPTSWSSSEIWYTYGFTQTAIPDYGVEPGPDRPAASIYFCLSCHADGAFTESGVRTLGSTKVISNDMRYTHPINVSYTAGYTFDVGAGVRKPLTISLTDSTITCRTCHDPHNRADIAKFLTMAVVNGDSPGNYLCMDCHTTGQ